MCNMMMTQIVSAVLPLHVMVLVVFVPRRTEVVVSVAVRRQQPAVVAIVGVLRHGGCQCDAHQQQQQCETHE